MAQQAKEKEEKILETLTKHEESEKERKRKANLIIQKEMVRFQQAYVYELPL